MKISILLPYKEDYSKDYAGAVSIFINGINKNSKFKSTTKIFGNTIYKNPLSSNYINILSQIHLNWVPYSHIIYFRRLFR